MDLSRPLTAFLAFIVMFCLMLDCLCRDNRNKENRRPVKFGSNKKGFRPTDQIAWVEYPAELTCPLGGRAGSPFAISWKKNDVDVDENADDRYDFSEDYARFTIFHSTEEDSGVYTCQAIYGDGPVSRNITLTVADPEKAQGPLLEFVRNTARLPEDVRHRNLFGNAPYFTEIITEKNLRKPRPKGRDVNLKCKAEGTPEPDVYWYKNGVPTPRTPEFQSGKRKSYSLENLEESDSGNYTCVAVNYFGNVTRTYVVEVDTCILEKPMILSAIPLAPRVLAHTQVTLECVVESCREAPVMKWFKQIPGTEKTAIGEFKPADFDGTSLDCRVLPHKAANQYRCAYTFSNFTAADVGVYACYAVNQLRKNDMMLVPLTLQEDTGLDQARQEENMRYLCYSMGGVVALVAICVIGACCCVYCGRSRSEKANFTPPRSTSSTFKRQPAPDYIVTGRAGHQPYEIGQYAINISGSPPSPNSSKTPANMNAIRDPLLENCSPDHSMLKYDGMATEYEEVEEDLSVYDHCTGHAPSFVSGYAYTAPVQHYR